MYCVKLNRSDYDFWHSSICKITTMINIFADEQNMNTAKINNEYYESTYFKTYQDNLQNNETTITSMSQIIV